MKHIELLKKSWNHLCGYSARQGKRYLSNISEEDNDNRKCDVSEKVGVSKREKFIIIPLSTVCTCAHFIAKSCRLLHVKNMRDWTAAFIFLFVPIWVLSSVSCMIREQLCYICSWLVNFYQRSPIFLVL